MKILIAIDGSRGAEAALAQALAWHAAGLRAGYVLANVQAPPSLYEVLVARDAQVIDDASRGAAEHLLAPASVALAALAVPAETAVGQGDAGTELVALAERFECDAIVLGLEADEAPGSVVEAVLGQSRVAVIVARPSVSVEPDEADDS